MINTEQSLKDAWLNIGDIDENLLFNPLDYIYRLSDNDRIKIVDRLAWLMSRPEYFSFTCKYIFGVDISPLQALLLSDMWDRKFPMLIGSRGLSKALEPDCPVLTPLGWTPIKELRIGDTVYGSDGKETRVTSITERQTDLKFYKIALRDGRTINACEDHMWKVREGGRGEWREMRTADLLGYQSREYNLPVNDAIEFNRADLPVDPYMAGKLCKDLFKSGIPTDYLFSSVEQRTEFLNGVYQSCVMDGVFSTSNEELASGLRDIVRSLGKSCAMEFCGGFYKLYMNLSYFANVVQIAKIERISDRDGYCIQVDNSDHTYITKDFIVTHNSFTLSLYSMLRAFLLPQRKIVVVGSAFRQSKILFEYCENIWKNAPVLRDLCDNNSGPAKEVDRCIMRINDGTVVFLPMGDGGKIRGQRAHDIVADELACLRANTLVQTNHGLLEIKDYLNGEAYSLLNKDNEFEYPEQIFRTPKTDVYRITTRHGYKFECSAAHQVMTQAGWKIAKDLVPGEDRLLMDFNDYFPERYISGRGVTLDETHGWIIGLLISEGCVTNRNSFDIKNTDKRLIDAIKDRSGDVFDWKEYYKEAYVDNRGWNCKESWSLKCNKTELRDAYYDFGLEYKVAKDKTVPKGVLLSPKGVVVNFLAGMYEGDGSAFFCNNRGKQEFQVVLYSSSEKLLETTRTLLLKFGVLCSIDARDVGTENLNYKLVARGDMAIKLFEVLKGKVVKWSDIDPGPVKFSRKPQIRKSENGKKFNLSTTHGNKNVHLGAFDTEEECLNRFNQYWANNREMLIVTSVEKLDEQEVLYDFYMPKTNSFIGNGFIQHNSIPRDIFENVVAGFAAVASSPIEKMKERAKINKAKELGIDSFEENSTLKHHKSNQIVLSGTAYYEFNHFADYWKRYSQIVRSRGDRHKLEELFGGEVPADFNWKDYGVYRIPVELLPPGYMDEGQIARSKATVHSGIFSMEFGSCNHPDSMIITSKGVKPIVDIKTGDLVLTHKGRYRRVEKRTFREYSGEMILLREGGQRAGLTPEHPVWAKGEIFIPARVAGEGRLPALVVDTDNDSGDCHGISNFFQKGFEIGREVAQTGGLPGHSDYLTCDNPEFLDGLYQGLFLESNSINVCFSSLAIDLKMAFNSIDKHCSLYGDDLCTLTREDKKNTSRDVEDYCGLVYNLEVEEDHSYCTTVGVVHNCFSNDSKGFFKRSLIESCVCSESNPIVLPSGEVFFSAMTKGNLSKKYVIGVDPASEADNFSIVVLEINDDHRRVVYCWTTTRERYRESFKASMTREDNYYGYCARKIRNLMKVFPTVEIALDPGGGGIAILEALHDREKIESGESAIWPVINPEKESETDGESGLHIIRVCSFISAAWNSEANHGLRKDMEDKVLLFPFFDSATLGFSLEEDKKMNRLDDTLEDCVLEIEELKNEMSLIVLTSSPSGRERWDTPDSKSGRKNKLRKDRYSALLMANDSARRLIIEKAGIVYDADYYKTVGFAERFKPEDIGKNYYSGPSWFTESVGDNY
jgi:intein/homing endonuclease